MNQKQHHQGTKERTSSSQAEETQEKWLCLPYVRGVSERIDRVCRTIDTVKIRTAFKPAMTLKRLLTRVKNKVSMEQKKGVVYEVPCGDCEKSYIGETGRTLKKRIDEHKGSVWREDKTMGLQSM